MNNVFYMNLYHTGMSFLKYSSRAAASIAASRAALFDLIPVAIIKVTMK